ncbi:hypothetical protein DB31_4646 [Hyalangium minutum]|uniref:Uncharacterized protein n=1 Tax=Hyalangium minutum TaxID=394096 RepID=A0A085VZ70_9BACT|nr:hypothetical protein DB31_4646 [Hyalangium minutum]
MGQAPSHTDGQVFTAGLFPQWAKAPPSAVSQIRSRPLGPRRGSGASSPRAGS